MVRMRASTRLAASLAALSVATFLFVTTETLPIGLIDPISHDLTVSAANVGLLVTYYGLVVVVASVPLTQLTRRIPRRRLLSALLGIYVVSALLAAVASSYLFLLVARVITAMSQALFWSIVVPLAAGLFEEKVRGRVISIVMAGSSIAAVAGVPLGTWVGQRLGWRWAFVALALIGTLVLVAVAGCLPSSPGRSASIERGSDPDRRRFWALTTTTVLFSAGAFTFFTYLSPFLRAAAGFSAGSLSYLLLLRGLAGLAGVALAGPLADRRPRLAVGLPVLLQVPALLLLFWWAGNRPLTVLLVALSGFTFAAFTTPLSARLLHVAPGRVDLASSIISTAVNVGITVGSLLGSALVDSTRMNPGGVRTTALAGGVLTAAGLAVLALDRRAAGATDRPLTSTAARLSQAHESGRQRVLRPGLRTTSRPEHPQRDPR
jgi:DHA1 family inner membrane transport protein